MKQYTDESLSRLHHNLRTPRRRLIIGILFHQLICKDEPNPSETIDNSTSDVSTTVRRLSREIVSIEEGVPLNHATGEPYHNVYTSLIQTHLPELDAINAVSYDDERKTVFPEQNLLLLAVVTNITSPLAQLLFFTPQPDQSTRSTDFESES